MEKLVRVLIVEDNENDVLLEVNAIKNIGYQIYFEHVETAEAMREKLLSETWDCIISDYSLPQFSGLGALEELQKTNIDIPFILVSGTIGEDIAVAAMKAGAHDYIMKDNMQRLAPAFDRALRDAEIRRQKKQAEETIRYERILLRALIDNLPDTIYIKDNQCRKIIANKADLFITGWASEADIIGKTDLEVFNGEIGKRGYDDDMNIIKTGKPLINREEEFVDKHGNQRWLHTTKIPIYNEQGQISGLVGIGHDITEQKRADLLLKESEENLKKQNMEYASLNEEYLVINEELTESLTRIQKMNAELMEAKDKAEESDKLKSAFLANMSHEIRTPVNAIMGFSSLLTESDVSEEKQKSFTQIIHSNCQQLLSIISDVIDISKIEAGQINIDLQPLNIDDFLGEIYLTYKKQAETKKIGLIYRTDQANVKIKVETDEGKLKQVLSNLLNNALKFTETGFVEYGFYIKQGMVEFYVKDTGIGIAPENQKLIFERFRQVETTYTRFYGGNGLGLSISKALIEKLGGTIDVVSELGKGTTFSFTIPYTPEKNTEENVNILSSTDKDLDWNTRTILIVEDETYNHTYLEEILLDTHVKILHAWDGKEAVEIVKKNPEVSLVLMDIKMPEMNGYEATKIIKKINSNITVIAQTAYALSQDRVIAIEAGCDNYISKPISKDELIKLLSIYLS